MIDFRHMVGTRYPFMLIELMIDEVPSRSDVELKMAQGVCYAVVSNAAVRPHV